MLHQLALAEMPKSAEDPELVLQAALLTLKVIGGNHRPDAWEIRQRIDYIDSMITVAAIDEGTVQAVGSVGIPESAVPGGDINLLAVAPEYQGDGIGRDVVGLLERKAKEAGLEKLQVQSSYGAKGFYQRLGYRVINGADFMKTL
jgi:ribosomal protein S18 acetylase RimI-like enzyme